jgi:hypothetical protein
MPLASSLKALLDWAPTIQMLVAINSAPSGKERVFRALELLDYLASKTPSPIDNELLTLARQILLTPQGGALLDYLVAAAEKFMQDQPPKKP